MQIVSKNMTVKNLVVVKRWDTGPMLYQLSYEATDVGSMSIVVSYVPVKEMSDNDCQRGNRAKKRGWLGGRIITSRNEGKNSQTLRNPLKFAFLTIFG